ncbi:glycosyltransferase family 39 protein [Trichocoleus desertorum AS-A10]|uniref:glycosyltransferase family 39 protein n=1 Tax=Trichocoleus desertorum TaxID=1481672 RepID=UPI003299C5BA
MASRAASATSLRGATEVKVRKQFRLGRKRYPIWLKLLLLTSLLLGLCFRFVNLDRKLYWHDEALTSLRVFGYTQTELVQQAFNGQVVEVAALQKYHHPSPDKGWGDTLTALAGNAEHPPLYYLLARLWSDGFGSSVAAMRSLPAVISLFAFPCIYWLCLELFESSLTAAIACALIAIAPFHVIYAQEAREYSLWAVTVLFSSASFLRALRLQTKQAWGLYAIAVSLSLYTHALAGLVSIAHGVYLLATQRDRLFKTFKSYALAAIAGLVTFLPWIVLVVQNWAQVHAATEGVRRAQTLHTIIGKWFINLNRVFVDIELGSANIIFVLLAAVVFYWLCRHTAQRIWLFIVSLIVVTAFPLVIADLILQSRYSTNLRYLTPCYIALELAVAYYLATHLRSRQLRQHKVARTALVTLVAAGSLSCLISSQSEVWWHKSIQKTGFYPEFSRIVDRTTNPLIISDSSNAIDVLSLSHSLDPQVHLQLLPATVVPQVPGQFSDVFLFSTSIPLREMLERTQNFQSQPLSKTRNVFHLTKLPTSLRK